MICQKKTNLLLLSCLLFLQSPAQEFRYRAALEAVPADGFYHIPLGPELAAYLHSSLQDLRIVDESSDWVPYVKSIPAGTNRHWESWPIRLNQLDDSGRSILLISNPRQSTVSRLYLHVQNAAVSRWTSISGSNDQRQWFILNEHLPVTRAVELAETDYLQALELPSSQYAFYKLIIDNNQNDPLQIRDAGTFTGNNAATLQQYAAVPRPKQQQLDTARSSLLELEWDQQYWIDRLIITAMIPRFFDRTVQICRAGANGAGAVLAQYRIRSFADSIFELPRIQASALYIRVLNGDNPPLQFNPVRVEARQTSIYTYLEKKHRYSLLLGNDEVGSPAYDLERFRDSIPNETPELNLARLPVLNGNSDNTRNAMPISGWIWLALISSAALLGRLAYHLIQELKKREA